MLSPRQAREHEEHRRGCAAPAEGEQLKEKAQLVAGLMHIADNRCSETPRDSLRVSPMKG